MSLFLVLIVHEYQRLFRTEMKIIDKKKKKMKKKKQNRKEHASFLMEQTANMAEQLLTGCGHDMEKTI